MNYAWVMRQGVHRLLVEVGAKYTNIGLSSVSGEGPFGAVVLMHDLASLQLLTPCIRYMKEQELSPELYVWDLDSPEPEFIVVFPIPMPNRHMLRTLVGKHLADLTTEQSEDARFELAIMTAGDGFKGQVREFLDSFKTKGYAAIMLAEAFEKDSKTVEDTTLSFVIDTIHEHQPVLVE